MKCCKNPQSFSPRSPPKIWFSISHKFYAVKLPNFSPPEVPQKFGSESPTNLMLWNSPNFLLQKSPQTPTNFMLWNSTNFLPQKFPKNLILNLRQISCCETSQIFSPRSPQNTGSESPTNFMLWNSPISPPKSPPKFWLWMSHKFHFVKLPNFSPPRSPPKIWFWISHKFYAVKLPNYFRPEVPLKFGSECPTNFMLWNSPKFSAQKSP